MTEIFGGICAMASSVIWGAIAQRHYDLNQEWEIDLACCILWFACGIRWLVL